MRPNLTSNVTEQKDEGPSPNGFGEVNNHTSGTEFYGPAATLAFLIELRSRARSFQSQACDRGSDLKESRKISVVNFFHSADYDVSGKNLRFL